MGRQINFFFDKHDEIEFLEIFNSKSIKFLRRNTNLPKNEIYEDFDLNPYGESIHPQLYICHMDNMPNINYFKIEESYYFINTTISPVVEFIRSGLNPVSNTLVSGRLWLEMKYWDKDKNGNSILVTKDKKLEELYNSLAKWIRKYCTRLPNGNYIGPHAMELYKKGAKLSS